MASSTAMSDADQPDVLQREHENSFVNVFVLPNKRERWSQLLGGRRRFTILGRLAGWDDFVPTLMQQLPTGIAVETIVNAICIEVGTSDKLCWVVSDWPEIDRKLMPLREAIQKAVGLGLGTLVSVVPGVLIFYESETGYRFLLRPRIM